MAIPTYNPYKASNTTFTDGLDYIISNLLESPTFDDLNDTIVAYFNSLPDPPGDLIGYMPISNSNTVNDYINSKIAQNLNFNGGEAALVDAVLCGIKEGSIESMGDFLEAAIQQVAEVEGVNTISKTALYGAAGFAQDSNAYWQNVVTTPGGWATYINSNAAINYANIPHWVEATYVGTFSGFAQIQAPSMGEANAFNFQGRSGAGQIAISTALALTAGKVIFKWAKRPVVVCGCNS